MFGKLIRALSAVADVAERVEGLEARQDDLEGRMDTDEAKRIEWVGTVKRTLARINKADQRSESNGDRGSVEEGTRHHGSDYAEAQRLGLIGRRS